MTRLSLHRRAFMSAAAVAAGTACAASIPAAAQAPASKAGGSSPTRVLDDPAQHFRFCLNTSTIRGQRLGLVEEVELAAAAGYDGIEPWMNEINAYRESGGSLDDLRRRIADAGLRVESAIGFANWIVDDDARRAEGLEALKRDMELVQQIGGTRIAAPPAGATDQAGMDLMTIAQRYRAALEVGQAIGVVPQLELWGFSKTLSRMGELLFVVTEAAHPQACVLPDIYHIYKGGSGFGGLRVLSGAALHVFHVNDYPADPPRETIRDADRVYPGDGVAPVVDILEQLYRNGFHGALSLELFNPSYYERPAREVLETGLRKMRESVARLPSATRS